MGLGDRIAVLNLGRLQQIGTPDEIYHRPANTFVATFVGSPPMNLVPRDGRLVGFRPENVRLSTDGQRLEGASFACHVIRIENLGSDRYVYLRVKGDEGDTNVIAKLAVAEQLPVKADEDTQLSVEPRHLSHFDQKTGDRIAA